MKTKKHKESNSCEKYYFLIDAFFKINFSPILKKLSQKIDFRHFPLFEIIAHQSFVDKDIHLHCTLDIVTKVIYEYLFSNSFALYIEHCALKHQSFVNRNENAP